MPWCPNCRNEYVEGITVCADCGTELVDELPKETAGEAPVTIGTVDSEEIGKKIVTYLQYGGVTTASLLPGEQPDHEEFQLVVAHFEKVDAEMMFASLGIREALNSDNIPSILPQIDDNLAEIEEEEASQMLSELRTESSSVYVKQRDKYNDLKFSGISFIVFGLIGLVVLFLNLMGILSFFNTFSSVIMAVVFVIFFIVGISSLVRANKMKEIVKGESEITDEVMDWIQTEISDEWIDSQVDPEKSEEDNYFQAHSALCALLSEKFPLLDADYVDQLMDDRYSQYCDNQEQK